MTSVLHVMHGKSGPEEVDDFADDFLRVIITIVGQNVGYVVLQDSKE